MSLFPAPGMSNSTSLSKEASTIPTISPQKIKKKRSLPGNPDPDAEVIALSPKTLLATNRFVCEICNKGFQRDQNLQLHRRGHNLPWKLKQRNSKEVKKRAYVCPEPSCVHHNPSRALGDLTGIKKHYCRKHGEKKWKCDKCSKIYAVQSDWKAHSKTCGTREYRCDCGTLFSRKDSFITHRAFCDALAEESARLSANLLAKATTATASPLVQSLSFLLPTQHNFPSWDPYPLLGNPNPSNTLHIKPEEAQNFQIPTLPSPLFPQQPHNITHHHEHEQPLGNLHGSTQPSSNAATSAHLSATALLQKAATVGAAAIPGPVVGVGQRQQQQPYVGHVTQLSMSELGTVSQLDSVVPDYVNIRGRGLTPRNLKSDRLTRDFLGLTEDADGGGDGRRDGAVDVGLNVKGMLTFTGGVESHQPYGHHHHSLSKSQQGFGFPGTTTAPETWGNC